MRAFDNQHHTDIKHGCRFLGSMVSVGIFYLSLMGVSLPSHAASLPGLPVGVQCTFNRLGSGPITISTCDPVNVNNMTGLIKDHYLNTLNAMTDAIVATLIEKNYNKSRLNDAQNATKYQLALDQENASLVQQGQVSQGVCSHATAANSLFASERKATINTKILSNILKDQDLLNASGVTKNGALRDKEARQADIMQYYCDPSAYASSQDYKKECKAKNPALFDKDIDATYFLSTVQTLKLNWNDSKTSDDERAAMAFAQYLYNNQGNDRIDLTPDDQGNPKNINEFMEARSLQAIRNVARNSYLKQIGLKSSGAGGNTEFLKAAFNNLGVPAADIKDIVTDNPSYYAQMGVLTKTLLQNPQFYVNTGVGSTNLIQLSQTLAAVHSMQKRDIFEAFRRREMLMSLLAELKIRNKQTTIASQ